MIFTGIIGSFIAVMLTGEWIQRRGRFFVFLVPILYLTVIYLSGLLTKDTWDIGIIILAPSIIAMMISFVCAKIACSRQFYISRFLIWQSLCLLSMLTVLLTVGAYAWCLSHNLNTTRIVFEAMLCGAICSIIYVFALLPFEMLLFCNPFWRKRFEAIFGLKIPEQGNLEQQKTFAPDDDFWRQLGDKL